MNVLAVLPGLAPTTIINIITPLRALHQQSRINAIIRMEWEVTPQDVAWADILVLCRNSEPDYAPVYTLAHELGIPSIYDLDDHVLAAPEGSETQRYFSKPSRRDYFIERIQSANLVRVHSPTLIEVVTPINPHCHQVWSAVDWSLVPETLPTLPPSPIRIVYASQPETGWKLFPFIRDDLVRILDEFPDRVHLHLLGYNPPEMSGRRSVTFEPFEGDYAAYFTRFTRAGYAIGLAPMIDDLFHNAKTNIKFKDYAAAGAAGIYADTPLYNGNGVVDGETGLLVTGEAGSWYAAIRRLIEQPDLIDHIRTRARAYAEQRYTMDAVGAMWLRDLESMPSRPPLTEVQRQSTDELRWWFTKAAISESGIAALLRRIMKRLLSRRVKQAYYRFSHALLRLRR
jgi:glycosyltransferase involved in cell wall biosynthesis